MPPEYRVDVPEPGDVSQDEADAIAEGILLDEQEGRLSPPDAGEPVGWDQDEDGSMRAGLTAAGIDPEDAQLVRHSDGSLAARNQHRVPSYPVPSYPVPRYRVPGYPVPRFPIGQARAPRSRAARRTSAGRSPPSDDSEPEPPPLASLAVRARDALAACVRAREALEDADLVLLDAVLYGLEEDLAELVALLELPARRAA